MAAVAEEPVGVDGDLDPLIEDTNTALQTGFKDEFRLVYFCCNSLGQDCVILTWEVNYKNFIAFRLPLVILY